MRRNAFTKGHPTRRDFIGDLVRAGACLGLGAFAQSCAEKEIAFTTDLANHYIEALRGILAIIREREMETIQQAAALAVQARLQGHNLYEILIGDMVHAETAPTRTGIPAVFKPLDIDSIARNDFVLTNTPEPVRGLSEWFVTVVGITNPDIVGPGTPPSAFANMGGLRIEDVSSIIINCHIPYTDGILPVEGIDLPICPASGIVHSLIHHTIAAEIVGRFAVHGIYPDVG